MSPFVDAARGLSLAKSVIPGLAVPEQISKPVSEIKEAISEPPAVAKRASLDTLRADVKTASHPGDALAKVATVTDPLKTMPKPSIAESVRQQVESTGEQTLADVKPSAAPAGILQSSLFARLPEYSQSLVGGLVATVLLGSLLTLALYTLLSARLTE